jgi:hypothetical protein
VPEGLDEPDLLPVAAREVAEVAREVGLEAFGEQRTSVTPRSAPASRMSSPPVMRWSKVNSPGR